jgi:hypothetical protein
MIRRGFWLLVGAVAGIIGYRRVSSLGRQLSGTLSPAARGPLGDGTGGDGSPLRVNARSREALSRKARPGLVRGTIRFTRDARRFGRDVREGMDLYMVRRTAQGSPTLDAGAESRRSPARPLVEALGANTDNDERVKDDR